MYAKITHMGISLNTTAPAACDTVLTVPGFRPQKESRHIDQSIDRVAASGLPRQIKKWLLIGLFYVGSLAGAWGAELRTNAGIDLQARVMFDTASNGTGSYAAANYIALTENNAAPAAGDTTLTGELNNAGGGLNRAQATYAHTNGTNIVTLTKTFTKNVSDGGAADTRTVAKAGNFNASTVGTLAFETLVTPTAPMVSGDLVAITWTKTL